MSCASQASTGGRGHLFCNTFATGARIVGKGERILNMIHRDDLAGSSAALSGRAGENYNAGTTSRWGKSISSAGSRRR